MPFRFSGPCCCCKIVADDFNRSDSSDLGEDWTEAAGSWEIASNLLSSTGGATARLAIATDAHPAGINSAHVTARLAAGGDLAEAGIVTNYVDTDNYSVALIIHLSPGNDDVLELWDVNGGVETLKAGGLEITNLAAHDLTVCHHDGIMVATTNGFSLAAAIPNNAGGDQVGLFARSSATETLTFDNFEFQRHKTDGLPQCPSCRGDCDHCQNATAPEAFKVVLTGPIEALPGELCSDAQCEAARGTYIVYKAADIDSSCYWRGDDFQADCNTEPPDEFSFQQVFIDFSVAEDKWVVLFVWSIAGGASPGSGPSFQKFYEERPDCIGFSDETLPFVSNLLLGCDGSNITCKITALP
ncbi:MAG: hypothetical protein GY838_03890 [bacterium]|nr:hypothetical protein [bacterium]